MRRRIRKRIVRQKGQPPTVIVQEFPNKMQRPWIFRRRGHRGEPDLPVDSLLIGSNDRRPAIGIAGLGFEFVFLPLGLGGNVFIDCSFKKYFVALAADGSRSYVGGYPIEWSELVNSPLSAGNEA